MAIRYPKRLNLALTPTPLEFMPRLTEFIGGPRIYFKRDDLTGSALSGNKVRKLEFSLAQALDVGADVVITAGGIQSNHCRATALLCAKLGLECHLILRGEQEGPADGNLLLDYLADAKFSFFPREVYSTSKPEIVADLTARYATEGKTAYWIPVGASNAIGCWGYVRAFEELMAQADSQGIQIDHIVTAMGSGGTAAGLALGRHLTRRATPEIWAVNVCDDAASFERDLGEIFDEVRGTYDADVPKGTLNIRILDGYVGEGYAIPYPEEMALIQTCGRLEGQILDPVYTGKALYGMRQEIEKGTIPSGSNVVFVHTGGIFGLFPQKHLFSQRDKNA